MSRKFSGIKNRGTVPYQAALGSYCSQKIIIEAFTVQPESVEFMLCGLKVDSLILECLEEFEKTSFVWVKRVASWRRRLAKDLPIKHKVWVPHINMRPGCMSVFSIATVGAAFLLAFRFPLRIFDQLTQKGTMHNDESSGELSR